MGNACQSRRKWWRGNFIYCTRYIHSLWLFVCPLLYTSQGVAYLLSPRLWASVFIQWGEYIEWIHTFLILFGTFFLSPFFFFLTCCTSAVDRKQSRELKRGATKAFLLLPFGPARLLHRDERVIFFSESSLYSSLHLDNLSRHWEKRDQRRKESEKGIHTHSIKSAAVRCIVLI